MNTLLKSNHIAAPILNSSVNTDVLSDNFFYSFGVQRRENDQAYYIEVAVPGLSKKDITVELQEGVLRVTGSKKTGFHFSSDLLRSFVLPKDADTSNINAKCKNGLLMIEIKKMRKNSKLIRVHGDSNEPGFTGWMKWKDKIKRKLSW